MTNVTEAKAIYADVAIDINDQLTLTIGGRQTKDDRKMTVQQYIDIGPIPMRNRNQSNFMDRSGYIPMWSTADIVANGRIGSA
jgi:outer membrane receptor protein involved in Fe transport